MGNFTPVKEGQSVISATSTHQAVVLNTFGTSVLVTNTGPYVAYVGFNSSESFTVTSLNGLPILPNSAIMLERGPSDSYVGAVCNTSETAIVRFNPGYGS